MGGPPFYHNYKANFKTLVSLCDDHADEFAQSLLTCDSTHQWPTKHPFRQILQEHAKNQTNQHIWRIVACLYVAYASEQKHAWTSEVLSAVRNLWQTLPIALQQ